MKFNFKIQPFQTDAVNSVINVFEGQKYHNGTKYNMDRGLQERPEDNKGSDIFWEEADDTGFKNEQIMLDDVQLLDNIHSIQEENNIKNATELNKALGRCSLDVEMETGTGKTYVYIKTMFELNKKYGWSKFVVVVPSIAIREGVKKSFEMTVDHFMEYYGKKARYFIYNSSNLNQLDNFSSDSGINVMIINTQAFAASLKEGGRSKESRIIYSVRDEFQSRRPIDVIKANRPILILDEPQKMGGDVTKKALKNFNPLFSLNYSATHKEKHNLVYVLDALDAFNKKLVKKIQVKGFEVKNLKGTNGYLFLENIVLSQTKPPKARLEFEVAHNGGIKRESRVLGEKDDLYPLSKNMEEYKGYTITEIDPFSSSVSFVNGVKLYIGEVIGDVSEMDMRRIQIRETIESHFDKEKELFEKGIKTLSLFFIDEVAKYRQYDKDGNEVLGEYGKIFEEEYKQIFQEHIKGLSKGDYYLEYLNKMCSNPSLVHKGYFSIDKKGHAVDSTVKRGSEFSDDISAYDLILKNKERLLSFDEPTRFIFSHSALREGWDNPNVFQICTLKHSDSTTLKRQEVGRGLRICVNKDGNRMDFETCGENVQQINILTVIASESYAQFVGGLQDETKALLYDRPTQASVEYFEGKQISCDNGEKCRINHEMAKKINFYLISNKYSDEDGKITDKYRTDVQLSTLVPFKDKLEPMGTGIHKLIQAIYDDRVLARMTEDGNAVKPLENVLNKNFYKKEFQTLWNYINHKYAYAVEFDSMELIKKAIENIDASLYVTELKYITTTGEQKEDADKEDIKAGAGFGVRKITTQTMRYADTSGVKYDLIGKIAQGTILTRKSVATILQGIKPEKFKMFAENPEEFIVKTIKTINEQKATVIVNHIIYNRIDGCYDTTIFTAQKHSMNEQQLAFKGEKSIQDYVYTDGYAKDGMSNERKFAESLDSASEVCVYAKLPKGFQIPTPVGNYAPDWAIAFNEGAVKHIYFVAETKGSMDSMQLRKIEAAKLECAKKLFNDISTSKVRYGFVHDYQELLNIINAN